MEEAFALKRICINNFVSSIRIRELKWTAGKTWMTKDNKLKPVNSRSCSSCYKTVRKAVAALKIKIKKKIGD